MGVNAHQGTYPTLDEIMNDNRLLAVNIFWILAIPVWYVRTSDFNQCAHNPCLASGLSLSLSTAAAVVACIDMRSGLVRISSDFEDFCCY